MAFIACFPGNQSSLSCLNAVSINNLFLKAEGRQFPRSVPIPRVIPTLLLPFLGKVKTLTWKIRGKNSFPG